MPCLWLICHSLNNPGALGVPPGCAPQPPVTPPAFLELAPNQAVPLVTASALEQDPAGLSAQQGYCTRPSAMLMQNKADICFFWFAFLGCGVFLFCKSCHY